MHIYVSLDMHDKGRIVLLFKALVIVTGSLLVSIGIQCFFVPYKILDGGILGIALILNYAFGFPTGLTMLLLSLPIYGLAWRLDRSLFYSSIHGLLVSSLMIDWFGSWCERFLPYIQMPAPASAVAGGILIGTGVGLMLRNRASTGGTDLLALFLSGWAGLNVGLIIFMMDLAIIMIGGLLFTKQTLGLSLMAILAVGSATGWVTATGRKEEQPQ